MRLVELKVTRRVDETEMVGLTEATSDGKKVEGREPASVGFELTLNVYVVKSVKFPKMPAMLGRLPVRRLESSRMETEVASEKLALSKALGLIEVKRLLESAMLSNLGGAESRKKSAGMEPVRDEPVAVTVIEAPD